jgi:hypothetical protein
MIPHTIMTLDVTWDTSDHDIINNNIDKFYDPFEDKPDHKYHFDQHGEYRLHAVAPQTIVPEEELFDSVKYVDFNHLLDDFMDLLHPESVSVVYNVNLTDVTKVNPNFELLRPLFGWSPIDTIERTSDKTTQFACGRVSNTLKQHWRYRFLA